MEIDEPTSSASNITILSSDNTDNGEYEEEVI